MSRQKGFHIVEAVLIVVIIGLIGFLGYTAWNTYNAKNTASVTPTVTQPAADTTPTINTASDLDKASNTLDSTDIDGQDMTNLDQQTNF